MNEADLDRTLSRLLAAVGAEPEPALMTRVRARLEARAARPAWLAWAMRPAALGVSLALLVSSVGLSFVLLSRPAPTATGGTAGLIESLLEERGVRAGDVLPVPSDEGGTASDSGGAA